MASPLRLFRRLASSRTAAQDVIEQIQQRFTARLAPSQSLPPLPEASEIRHAVSAVAYEKNGYLAWALYSALRQGEVRLQEPEMAQLAGTMLHIDHSLDAKTAAQRTFSVFEAVQQSGEAPGEALLEHAAAACALAGLPDRAEVTLRLQPGTCFDPAAFPRKSPALLALVSAMHLTPGFDGSPRGRN